ncbi:MAG: hypothetical protein V1857_04280 [archaeon]
MKILNGNTRYGLPVDSAGKELVCAQLNESERALIRPDLGVSVGNIRIGKRAYNCAFVLSTNGIWIYMSKSTFLNCITRIISAERWGTDIEVQYTKNRGLVTFPPSLDEQKSLNDQVDLFFGLSPRSQAS